jgi:hypothetical protein
MLWSLDGYLNQESAWRVRETGSCHLGWGYAFENHWVDSSVEFD